MDSGGIETVSHFGLEISAPWGIEPHSIKSADPRGTWNVCVKESYSNGHPPPPRSISPAPAQEKEIPYFSTG